MAGERLDWQGNLVFYRSGPAVPTYHPFGSIYFLINQDSGYCPLCGLERHHWPGCSKPRRRKGRHA